MLRTDSHLTDRQIVLLVDGELPSRDRRTVEEHLAACWSCRSRAAEIQSSIAAFVHLYHDRLNAQLPPVAGPRALLRAQLENQSRPQPAIRWNWVLAAACLVVCALLLRGVSLRPGDLSIPQNRLTPGETRNVTLGDVCGGTTEPAVRTVPVSLRQQVFREYGIRDMRPNAYEVDYLITPELGGSSTLRNLWPQPYSAVWNAHVKDELEDRLHGLVCTGQVDLTTAQREISTDWIGAYKKYFHTDKPF